VSSIEPNAVELCTKYDEVYDECYFSVGLNLFPSVTFSFSTLFATCKRSSDETYEPLTPFSCTNPAGTGNSFYFNTDKSVTTLNFILKCTACTSFLLALIRLLNI
jgi:hypothetical protein